MIPSSDDGEEDRERQWTPTVVYVWEQSLTLKILHSATDNLQLYIANL